MLAKNLAAANMAKAIHDQARLVEAGKQEEQRMIAELIAKSESDRLAQEEAARGL